MRTAPGAWRGVDEDVLRRRWGVPVLQAFDRVASTSDVARRLAEAGAPAGTTVLADEQTAGRGRRGRSWLAEPGSSLLLSMVVRGAARSPLSLRLGLAAASAIESLVPARVGLKWPNDLRLDGRKVGGILCEASAGEGDAAFVVAGIGLNLHQHDDWPAELAGEATSLEAAVGPVDDIRLAGHLVRAWLAVAGGPHGPLSARELRAYAERDVLRGRAVTVDGRPAGVVRGLDPSGALRLDTADGVRSIIAGTVRASIPDS